jgi:hypothetical protein
MINKNVKKNRVIYAKPTIKTTRIKLSFFSDSEIISSSLYDFGIIGVVNASGCHHVGGGSCYN